MISKSGLFIIILLVACSLFFVSKAFELEYGTQEVDCFDKNDNKIIGEKCLKLTDWDDTMGLFVAALFFLGMAFIIIYVEIADVWAIYSRGGHHEL